MAKQNSIFISYRRTNTWTAQAVYQYLDAHGYDVFFDVDSIRTGDWKETILSQIRARAHFIIILTPSAVERFREPNDIMRLEIETAIDEQRNIIPLMFEDLDFPSIEYAITGKLAIIPKYNGMEIPARFFKYAMQDLCESWLDVDVDAVIHPTPPQLTGTVEAIQKSSHDKPEIDEDQLQAEKLYEQGIELHQKSQYQEAIDLYTKAIELMPLFAEAFYRRGHAFYNINHKKATLKDYQTAVDIDSNNPNINLMKAYLFLELGQLDDALSEARIGLELNPELDEAYYTCGQIQLELQDYKSAIQNYDSTINLNAKNVMAFYNRGLAKKNLQDLDGAIDDYTQVIDLNPQFIDAYFHRGDIRYIIKDYHGAINDYTQAIAIDSQSAQVYYKRGNAKRNIKDYHGAVIDYEQALKIDPEHKRTNKNLKAVRQSIK